MSQPNVNIPVPEPVQTATKAINTSIVLTGGWLALVIKSWADGSISWAEGYEIIGAAVVALGSIYATWKSRNKTRSTHLRGA
jgi:hypothetical protein